MSKTAEQFDAEVAAINEKLKVDLKPVFQVFYDAMIALADEMSKSNVPKHLQVAIAAKGVREMEAAIDAISLEIETWPLT